MTNLLIRHKVNDYAAWKVEFDNFAEFRKSSGEKSYRILHPEGESNNLTLLFEWDNPGNARKFLESTELRSTMQRAGVAEEPEIRFLEEIAQGAL
jgi:hypothetical protein